MATRRYLPGKRNCRWPICLIALLVAGLGGAPAWAEDWGAYALIPVSAPQLVLEAVDSGDADGTAVSLGKPAKTANQKWTIEPAENGLYTVRPAYDAKLALAVAKGGEKNGTPIVLETASGQPWQLWTLKKNDNGSYCLIPQHAEKKGLDHFAGKAVPGARIDLWTNHSGDPHLEWIVQPLAGTTAPVASVVSAAATPTATPSAESGYVPREIDPDKILKGEIKEFQFSASKIFPGTVRQVTVFVPAQYKGDKPACVYVKMDGYRNEEQPLLEKLIASGEMPVTVGVFVTPGNLPASVGKTPGRTNRCFEYDGVSDNNVRFLVEEILPDVAKRFNLKLSTDGNDRCIVGGSSGGITAFNAAWQRPDAFSRVYANSGSFVAFRGGNEFSTLVRKFEAKPIRAFLTTGTRDMENCAGDWFLTDQEMDKALRFSGYDYAFRVVQGGHVAGYYDYFPEAMSYLWRDWPQPVKAGESAPRVRDVIVPGEGWQPVADDRHDARGPACNAQGDVFFVDTEDDKIFRIDVGGAVKPLVAHAGHANSLTVGPDGTLYAASKKTGKIIGYDASGNGTPLAEGIRGEHLLAAPNGALFVTVNGEKPGDTGSVWLVKGGQKTQLDSGLKFATGLAYRSDQWLLSVADGGSKWAYSFQINGDGSLTNRERYFWLHVPDWQDDAGAESMCQALEGSLLVATRFGVQICADDGPTQVILPVPDGGRVLGVCFGGPELSTLFAFCGDKIWKRKVKIHGFGAFSPWAPGQPRKL